MTIYVDQVKHYPNTKLKYKYWSHMATDQDDLTELHTMAEKLGLRQYFQQHATMPHYDVVPTKRALAIKYGAVAVDTKELVTKCSLFFKKRKQHGSNTG